MKAQTLKKKKSILDFLVVKFMCMLLLIGACKKEDKDNWYVNNPTNNDDTSYITESVYSGTYINSSVYGEIVDEAGNPVEDADVNAFGQTTTSNEFGVFYLNNVSIDSKRAYVTVEKQGYFLGSRAFIPVENGTSKIKIMLMENTASYTVEAASGGTVQLSSGPSLEFPVDAVIDANGNAYTGTIKVAAKYLDPEDENLGWLMPGDLSALDENSQEVMLRTFGMLTVELSGNSGQKLQIATGKQVTLNMPIPSSLLSEAPETISLWYFDEEYGAWKEDGEATLVNGVYVGNVSHFTTWNCDWQGPRATVSGRVVDCLGNPASGIAVTFGGGNIIVYTDSAGYYTTWVAADPNIIIVVSVNEPNYGLQASITLGALSSGQQVNAQDLQVACPAYLTGSLIDCNSQPISGYVFIEGNGFNNLLATDASGNFTIMVPANSTLNVYGLGANDEASSAQVVSTPAFGSSLSLGNISLCQQVSITNSFYLNGGAYNNQQIVFNTIGGNEEGGYDWGATYINLYDAVDYEYLSFYGVPSSSVGSFNSQADNFYFNLNLPDASTDSSQTMPNIDLTITKYDAVGGKIEGTFSGTFQDMQNVSYTISSGQFSVTRKQ